jgi:hypothetical protein
MPIKLWEIIQQCLLNIFPICFKHWFYISLENCKNSYETASGYFYRLRCVYKTILSKKYIKLLVIYWSFFKNILFYFLLLIHYFRFFKLSKKQSFFNKERSNRHQIFNYDKKYFIDYENNQKLFISYII